MPYLKTIVTVHPRVSFTQLFPVLCEHCFFSQNDAADEEMVPTPVVPDTALNVVAFL